MKPLKPTKPSKQNKKPTSSFPKKYIFMAVAIAILIVAVISLLTGGITRSGGSQVDETEAQERWKNTGPVKKK